MSEFNCDVAIIGGGPAGSTVGTLLKKYNPDLHVVIFEKETFPRDHIGESQLPLISVVLDEMGCWDKVEAAGFPIKIGATYVWGRNEQPWDFNFVPPEAYQEEPRPGRFEGQRRYTAFQVDRSIYDDILLRHARECGVEVHEGTIIRKVLHEGDRITGFHVESTSEPDDPATSLIVRAKHYADCSGSAGIVRRALNIPVDSPRALRNIAFWDYWENAEWAERIGSGATRIQVRTLPYGWMWFIPLGPTRTSIGLVCHSDYYQQSGEHPETIYRRALKDESFIASLIKNATPRGRVESTRDWSYLVERMCGENWFLAGECAGFADPILSAGMTLAHTAARDVAYTILELEHGEHDPAWLRQRFNEKNRLSIQHHIRFAQFWYSANGMQTDLKEYCREIARDAGLKLNAADAFRWISQGSFTTELLGNPAIGFFDLTSIHDLTNRFAERGRTHKWLIDGHSVFKLNIHNAEQGFVGDLKDGRIIKVPCLFKGTKKLPLHEFYGLVVDVLQQTSDAETMLTLARNSVEMLFPHEHTEFAMSRVMEVLESMALDGWVICKHDRKRPPLTMAAQAKTIEQKSR